MKIYAAYNSKRMGMTYSCKERREVRVIQDLVYCAAFIGAMVFAGKVIPLINWS